MSGSKRLIRSLIAALLIESAWLGQIDADELATATVSDASACKAFVLRGGKFQPVKPTLKSGQKFRGSYHKQSRDYFTVRAGNETYAISSKCLSVTEPSAPSSSPDVTPSAPGAPVSVSEASPSVAVPKLRPFQLRTHFLAYQSTITIQDSVRGDFNIVSQIFGACPGGAYRRRLGSRLVLVGDLCVLWGLGEARGEVTDNGIRQVYGTSTASVLAFRGVPSLEATVFGEGVKLGLGVPFIYEVVGWDEPGNDGTLSTSAVRFPGLLLTFEASRDRFSFLTHFGFSGEVTQASWGFGFGYEL